MRKEHLGRCQVATPHDVVKILWDVALKLRPALRQHRVLDLGAGDARFARYGKYREYVGLEIDDSKLPADPLPKGARVERCDAMEFRDPNFDLCIGNPPYVRHHHLDATWRSKALASFEKEAGLSLKQTANAFILFLTQALLRTKSDGLVIQLVPFEWVSRPSALELRRYIESQRWAVSVCRFKADVFPSVLTTASITIIDKQSTESIWRFFEIDTNGELTPLGHPTGRKRLLDYGERPETAYALRGLSPGGQDIFVLTEEERLFFQLKVDEDVRRCVTSLRHLPKEMITLDAAAFRKHYIEAGKRCWLVRTDKDALSGRLEQYIAHVGDRWKQYTTCTGRSTWWRYRPHPAPALLVSSGFVGNSPKTVVNETKAIAVGAVYGVIASKSTRAVEIGARLRAFNFRDRVVSHSNNLKKVEVKQLNAVLATLTKTSK